MFYVSLVLRGIKLVYLLLVSTPAIGPSNAALRFGLCLFFWLRVGLTSGSKSLILQLSREPHGLSQIPDTRLKEKQPILRSQI